MTIPARTASATTSRPPAGITAAATGTAVATAPPAATTAITATTGRARHPWPSCLTKTRPGDAILVDFTGELQLASGWERKL